MKHNAEVQESRHDGLKWAVVVTLLVVAVVGNTYFADQALLYRVLGVVVLCVLAGVIALTTARGEISPSWRRAPRKRSSA